MNIKYFSQLTNRQKDKSIFIIRKMKCGLMNICDGLASIIMIEADIVPEINLDGAKMCYSDKAGVWLPLNLKEYLATVE